MGGINTGLLGLLDGHLESALSLVRTSISYRYFFNKYFCVFPTVSIFGDTYFWIPGTHDFDLHIGIIGLKPFNIGWSYNGAGINGRINKTYMGGGIEVNIPIGVITVEHRVMWNIENWHFKPKEKKKFKHVTWLSKDIFKINLILFEMIRTNGIYLKIDVGWLALGLTLGYDL